ncbi:MAG: hypothetical protein MJZ32_10615 [Bacteroidaceae bacterium]|nr:hypothetical protein [Bacteroidaceae bacterium]
MSNSQFRTANGMIADPRQMREFVAKMQRQMEDFTNTLGETRGAILKTNQLGFQDGIYEKFNQDFEEDAKIIGKINEGLNQFSVHYLNLAKKVEEYLKTVHERR